MTDRGDGLLPKLAEWVETSGSAIEMRVARAVRKGGAAGVVQSYEYTDELTGDVREADVVATWEHVSESWIVRLTCVIECKSGVSKPWVLFDDGHREWPSQGGRRPAVPWFLMQRGDIEWSDAGNVAWSSSAFAAPRPAAYAVVAALENEQSRKANQPNAAYRAVRQAVGAASKAQDILSGSHAAAPVSSVRIPLVVTAAPLYRCFLDDHDEPVLKRVEYGTVLVRPPGSPPGYKAVTIMNEMYLAETFVSQVGDLLSDLASAQ